MDISNRQKWFLIISTVIIILGIIIAVIPTDCKECERCNCPEQTCEYTREDMVALCEVTNIAIDLTHQQIDYINEFANPTDTLLKKSDKLICSNL